MSDIIREFGPGVGADTLTIFDARVKEQDRGPNARKMKFKCRLCADCNNKKSQPFDRAEELFTGYFAHHESEISRTHCIQMGAVFPTDTSLHSENLRRYFVKHVGCLVTDMGFCISKNVLSYLDGAAELFDISFVPKVCDRVWKILEKYPPGKGSVLGYPDPVTWQRPSTGEVLQITGVWCYRSFHLHWGFRTGAPVALPNPFCDDMALTNDPNPRLPIMLGALPGVP